MNKTPTQLLIEIQHNPHVLLMVDEVVLLDYQFARKAMLAHEDAYEYLDAWYHDTEMMRAMLKAFPHNYQKLPLHVRTQEPIARAAIEADPNNCAHVFPNAPYYEALMLTAVSKEPMCYTRIYGSLAQDPCFAQRALDMNPLIYGSLPLALQRTRTLAQKALDLEPSNIWVVMAHFRADHALMLQGFGGYPKLSLLGRVDPSLLSDAAFIYACTQISMNSLSKAGDALRTQLEQLVAQGYAKNLLEGLRYLICDKERAQIDQSTAPARSQAPKGLTKFL